MLIDRETGDEDSEIKVDPGQTSETERNAQKVKSFHVRISGPLRECHVGFDRARPSELTADYTDYSDSMSITVFPAPELYSPRRADFGNQKNFCHLLPIRVIRVIRG
jgi:hypothetical protein